MSKSFEKQLVPAAEWIVTALAVGAFCLGSAFLMALLTRSADALFGWHYSFQSIGDFLGIKGPHRKVLAWDRAFLLLGGALASGYTAVGVQGFIEWAQKSPAQRRRQRKLASEAWENQQRLEREKRTARKAARRPMSGWRRLWIVLSILFAIPAALIAWQPQHSDLLTVKRGSANDDVWAIARSRNGLSRCDWGTAQAKYLWNEDEGDLYSVECDDKDPLTPALLWSFFPALLMAGVGLTIRWVYRGFRAAKPSEAEPSRD